MGKLHIYIFIAVIFMNISCKQHNVYNENKKVVREFADVAGQYPQIIDPVKRHDVMKARLFMNKAKHTAMVKTLISEIKAMPVEPWNGKKVILTGTDRAECMT